MKDYSVRLTCRLCGDTRLTKLLSFPDTPLANEYPKDDGFKQDRFPLYLVGCQGCGHVQLPVVVRPERLFPPDYPYQSGTSPVFEKHLYDLAYSVGDTMRKGALLDIGCNDGTFARLCRERNIQAYGVDPSAPSAPWLFQGFFSLKWAKESGLKEFTSLGIDGERHGEHISCVTALNVFAHVDNLDDFTQGVAEVLEPDGIFIFEVGYLPDVVKRGLFATVYHEHVSYHHLTPLVPFFQKHGMFLYDAERIDSQGGSIRCYVRNCGGFQTQSKRLQELIAEENHPSREGLWRGVTELKAHGKRIGGYLSNFVKQCEGKVCGYGAPAKLTTLLAATNLYPASISYVLDDNPLKVGRFVPGTSIPIVPSSELYERKPKGVMLFSANFAEEIQARHSKYKGKWLVT